MPGEITYLDVNELAAGKPYCGVGSVEISPSTSKVAYTVDYSGDEKYEMHVKDLATGVDVALKEVGGGRGDDDKLLEVDELVWGKDDGTLYYTTVDEQHRPFRLFRRKSENWSDDDDGGGGGGGGGATIDTLLKEDMDDLFWCSVSKSLDEKYIFFESASKETSEVWYLPTDDDEGGEMKEGCNVCIKMQRSVELHSLQFVFQVTIPPFFYVIF